MSLEEASIAPFAFHSRISISLCMHLIPELLCIAYFTCIIPHIHNTTDFEEDEQDAKKCWMLLGC